MRGFVLVSALTFIRALQACDKFSLLRRYRVVKQHQKVMILLLASLPHDKPPVTHTTS